MSNIDKDSSSQIVKLFFKFHKELLILKNNIQISDDTDFIELQTTLKDLVEKHSRNFYIIRENEEELYEDEILYLLTTYIDELFITSFSKNGFYWENYLLEEFIFNTHVGGKKYFQYLKIHLESEFRESENIAILYFILLALGFKGKFMHYDEKNYLQKYKEKLFTRIFETNPNIFTNLKSLFPEAYNVNKAYNFYEKFIDYRSWIILILSGIFFTVLLGYAIFAPETLSIDFRILQIFTYNHSLEIFIVLFILIAIVIIVFVWIYLERKKFQLLPKNLTKRSISESFRLFRKKLRKSLIRKDSEYSVPWYLILGSTNPNDPNILADSILNRICRNPFEDTPYDDAVADWRIFENAVLINSKRDFISSQNTDNLWTYFVKQFKRKRSLRPLDGIIITLSASEFIASEKPQVESLNKLRKKADLLKTRIMIIQKKLRMSLPVYILITRSEKINGFTEFTQTIPKNFRQNIFGCSNKNSYSLRKYNKDWLSEAFNDITNRLTFLQLGIITKLKIESNAANLLQFAQNINSLKYPIQIFVNQIFQNNTESLKIPISLRGLYFTGIINNSVVDENSKEHVYLKDLFEQKIFSEAGLAQPISRLITK